MTMKRRTNVAGPSQEAASPDPLDTAWRIHAAVVDWTGKVDAKASFCFAVESAVLVAVVNLTATGRLFDAISTDWETRLFYAGVGFMVVALLCAAYVVTPRLRRFKTRAEWPDHFIYFGHLRKWQPKALEEKLSTTTMLPVLSKQLVNMSKIAWRKHVMVQASMVLGLVGAGCLGWCAALVN